MKRDRSARQAGAPGETAGLLAAAVTLLLAAGAVAAQEPSAGPGEEAAAGGESSSAAGEPAATAMPESLRSPVIDVFATGPVLQAHKLRGLRADVAGQILGSPDGGDIAFEALALPFRGAGGKADVSLFVEVDGPSFLQTNQRDRARVEVYAYALGADRQVVAYLAEVFALDVRELGEAVWQSGLKFFGHLELPPGEYRLRILVRNYHSGASALRERELTVPAFDKLSRPYFFPVFEPPANRDAWLPAREWQSPASYPLWLGGRAVSPVARPVLVTGRRSAAHVVGFGLPARPGYGRAELLRDGVAVASADLEVAPAREAAGGGKPEALAVTFDVPPVAPGNYALRMELNGAPSAPLPVIVLEDNTRDRALLWTDLRGQLVGGSDPAPREVTAARREVEEKDSRGKRDERRIRELAASYRQALAALSRDHGSAARSALLDLETSTLTDGTLEPLRTAQIQVARELADKDAESLIPLLVLHDDLYSAYRQRSLFSLGFHAREIIELVAELYAERGGSRGSHVVAARTLASLGGYLQEANLPSSSRRLYSRALAHDPGNVAALLGLATGYERYGDYPRAVAVLEDLVAAHPGFGEGLLRLAINLDRLGSRARARQLTEKALAADAPAWVRSIACQELARTQMEIGRLEEAARLLEDFLAEESPERLRQQGDGSVFLLAHVYDRLRRPLQSLDLLEGVTVTPERSPRMIYDGWPEDSLREIRRQLTEAAAVRVETVARALDGVREEDG